MMRNFFKLDLLLFNGLSKLSILWAIFLSFITFNEFLFSRKKKSIEILKQKKVIISVMVGQKPHKAFVAKMKNENRVDYSQN